MTVIAGIEKVLPLVAKISPLLADALGAPWGAIVLGTLLHAFNIPGNDTEKLAKAITNDPQAETRIKEIEASEAIQSLHGQVEDRVSARELEKVKIQTTGRGDWVLHFLAIVFTVGFFGYLIFGKLGIILYDQGVFHDLLNEESIVLLFYFGGMYKPSTNKG